MAEIAVTECLMPFDWRTIDDAFGRLMPASETCKAYSISNQNPMLKVNIILEVSVVTRGI